MFKNGVQKRHALNILLVKNPNKLTHHTPRYTDIFNICTYFTWKLYFVFTLFFLSSERSKSAERFQSNWIGNFCAKYTGKEKKKFIQNFAIEHVCIQLSWWFIWNVCNFAKELCFYFVYCHSSWQTFFFPGIVYFNWNLYTADATSPSSWSTTTEEKKNTRSIEWQDQKMFIRKSFWKFSVNMENHFCFEWQHTE